MITMNTQEVNALIQLLDDPDEVIYNQIKGKFISFGFEVIPHLEAARDDAFDEVIQTRIENIISTIQVETTAKELTHWAKEEEYNLLKGMLIISRLDKVHLDEEKIKSQLKEITQDVWLEINDNLTALEKIKIINHVLYTVHGFRGNTENYHSPENSYLHTVLNERTGNPISLSIIYLLICSDLNIPVYGIDLPLHFILGYNDDSASIVSYSEKGLPENMLFYINAFSNGIIFSKDEIDKFLSDQNIEPTSRYYKPCANLDIIKRVIRNLIASYERRNKKNQVENLKRLLKELNDFL